MNRFMRTVCTIVVAIALGLAGSTRVTPVRAASTAVVTLSPGAPNVANSYRIDVAFAFPVTQGSSILVLFDASNQTSVPTTIDPAQVGVYANGLWYAAVAVTVASQQVTVTMSSSLPITASMSLVFNAGAGIRPVTEGQHTLGVYLVSSLGTDYATGTYTVAVQNASPVTFSSVTIDNPGFGKTSSYQFSFTSGVNLYPGSSISVKFPTGFVVPGSISGLNFGLLQGGSRVSSFDKYAAIANNTVTLTIPTMSGGDAYSYFAAGIGITILCGPYTQIANPAVGGSYQFELWTSVQPTHAVKSVTMGSGVVNATVVVVPAVAGGAAEYRVSFNTSNHGSLQSGTDRVSIVFPAGFALPASITSGFVKLNGAIAGATVAGQTLTVTLPAAVSVSGTVLIVIDQAAGIRNGPASPAGYQLTVTTTADQLPVQTPAFAVSASVISSVAVSAVPAVKGATAAYTVSFATGAGGALGAGDTISLFLPYVFTVPSAIDRTQVSIRTPATAASGIQPASVLPTPSSQSIVLTLPSGSSIAAGASVAVSLPAVITNPTAGGAFTVKVSTSKETTAVDSVSFTIYNNPVSTLSITPVTLDGRAGYYISQPSFTLGVDGPASVTLSAFYRIDDTGAFLPYDLKTSPSVKVPEGKHTVSYYAQDSLGNVEPTRSQQVLVDLTDPVITVASPAEKSVVVQSSMNVLGRVSALDLAGLRLSVAGKDVPVSADGAFSAFVTLDHEGINDIQLVAASPSSRTTTLTLSVNYVARVTMSLVIGSPTVNLNNEFKVLEAAPFISKKGVTMVPLRFISEAFKADVVWDPVFKSVTLTLAGRIMRIQVGFLIADVGGKSFALQDAPVIVQGRTFVPLRFIAENFGARVEWNGALKMVSIVYPKP